MKKLLSIILIFCSYYANSQDLEIGDEFGGGIVFDIDQENNSCLVAYTSDIGSYPWGCSGTFLGADGTDVGTGQSNTETIVNSCDDFLFAAEECYNFSASGYSDWYLPSKDELLLMYYRISSGSTLGNIGNFETDYCSGNYSSSERDYSKAWIINLGTGSDYLPCGNTKDYAYSVRPVRTAQLVSSGCTDVTAYNYDENASQDDGSCLYSYQNIETAYQEGAASVTPEDGIGQSDVDAAYAEGAASVTPEDGIGQSDVDTAYAEGAASVTPEDGISQSDLDSISDSLDFQISTSINAVSSLEQALDTWNTTIDLSAGWNMFGYGCPSPIDVADGLSNHTDIISIVKDNNGNVYMPEFSFNGIGDFTPGFGYQIKVSEAIEGFSLCDWYVNDIPEDYIVSLQEELTILQDSLESLNSIITYQVGDIAQGGIVFYVDETAQHGLVSSLYDITDGAAYQQNLGTYGFSWGSDDSCEISGADGVGLGAGFQNTQDIINEDCLPYYGNKTAAQACEDHIENGYDDWWLPSKQELYLMYQTIGQGSYWGNVGGFGNGTYNGTYWSSTEADVDKAWYVGFTNDTFQPIWKYANMQVRPIRTF